VQKGVLVFNFTFDPRHGLKNMHKRYCNRNRIGTRQQRLFQLALEQKYCERTGPA
jgi:hypothetical protein